METPLHALRDCPMIATVWNSIVPPQCLPKFYSDDRKTWLTVNYCSNANSGILNAPWRKIFPFLFWGAWLDRNAAIFRGKWDGFTAFQAAKERAIEFLALCHFNVARNHQFIWVKPPNPFVILNSDGSVRFLDNRFVAGAGAVLRDHLGNWIEGCAINLGPTTIYQAEAWGLLKGVELVIKHGITHLYIELDSSSIVQAVTQGEFPN